MYSKYTLSTAQLKRNINNYSYKAGFTSSSVFNQTDTTSKIESKKDFYDTGSNLIGCHSTDNSSKLLTRLNKNEEPFNLGENSYSAIHTRNLNVNDKVKLYEKANKTKLEKVLKNKKEIELEKKRKKEHSLKTSEMRKLKLKIHKLTNKKENKLCSSLDIKNHFFNKKIEEYFQSEHFINKQIKYHSKFRFGNFYYGEAHDRFAMMKDLDNIILEKKKNSNLNNQFSDKEKKIISLDSTYFITNKKLFKKLKFLEHTSLTEKIKNEEEKEEIKKMKKNEFLRNNRREMARIENSISNFFQIHEENKKIFERVKNFSSKKNFYSTIKNNIFKILNTNHDENIKNYYENEKKKNKTENEMKKTHFIMQNISKPHSYKKIEIIKEQNLPLSEKKEFLIKSNTFNLRRIEERNHTNYEKMKIEKEKENEKKLLQQYVTKIRDAYIVKNNLSS